MKTVFIVILSCCAALIIGEVGLRILGVEYPLIYKGDWHRGSALAPGVEGWIRKEGGAYVKINSKGLRDIEYKKSKPDGVYRIAVLGDSFTEAVQVDSKDTFWSKLELKLGQCPKFSNYQIEVLNFGVSGYSTAQELITLRQYAWHYSPDLVLLAFYQGNDVEDNSKSLGGYFPRPFFYLDHGKLILDTSFRDSEFFEKSMSEWVRFKNWLINRVRILQLLQHTKTILDERHNNENPEERLTDGVEVNKKPRSSVYTEPRTTEWIDAWEVTERLIAEMDREVRDRGSVFLLVTLSTSIQVHPEPDKRDQAKRKMNTSTLFYPDDRLSNFAENKQINILNLARPMQAYSQKNEVFLHGFPNTELGTGHWNEAGHELAAELISDYLCKDFELMVSSAAS